MQQQHQYNDSEIAAVRGIRSRNGKVEAIVDHKALERPKSKTFATEREARLWKLTYIAELDGLGAKAEVIVQSKAMAGGVDTHMRRPMSLPAMLEEYQRQASLKQHGRDVLALLLNLARLKPDEPPRPLPLAVEIEAINLKWVRNWINSMKVGNDRIRPDSIKKKVQGLRAALDWYYVEYWGMAEMDMPANPVRSYTTMVKNYATYDQRDANRLKNNVRDRRLNDGEEQAIEELITGVRKRKCNRPLVARKLPSGAVVAPADYLMLFRLLINTGLRLREAYRLRMSDLELQKETLYVRKSKMTDEDTKEAGDRSLPLVPQLAQWLREYCLQRGLRQGSEAIVFPWWDGTDATLKRTTERLSKSMIAIFEDAGCRNLTAHDLRHEGVSRWCELRHVDGAPVYSDKRTLMIFTGHTEESTFARYVKLMTEHITPRKLAEQRARFLGGPIKLAAA